MDSDLPIEIEWLPPNTLTRLAFATAQAQEHSIDPATGFPESNLIGWAGFHLDSAVVGARLHNQTRGDGDANFLGVQYQAIEVSAMTLVFGSVVSALDLCAEYARQAADNAPPPHDRYVGLRWWTEERIRERGTRLQEQVARWLAETVGDPEWDLLLEARDTATHRTFARHIAVHAGASEPHTVALTIDGGNYELTKLLSRFLTFGIRRFESYCASL